MLPILKEFLERFEPFLSPIYLVSAWVLLILIIRTVFKAIADVIKTAKKMHQIPCSNCEYFTNNYRLKCTLHPKLAQTEGAISCSDYSDNELFN